MTPAAGVARDDEDLHIEACAVRAWPAPESRDSDGWLLRATPGVGRRRSNSAVPPVAGAMGGLGDVEAFYREKSYDSLIQVSPAHRHQELDHHLAARGYEVEAPTLVLRAPLAGSRNERAHVHHRVFHVEHGDRDRPWTQASDAIGGRADASGELVLDRIPGRTTFARAFRDDDVLGVGAGVLDGHRLGVFGMGTAVAHRRSGVAGAVLSALLRWGHEAGATSAWLQVEEANHPALELYAAHGFVLSHRYHYRRRAL